MNRLCFILLLAIMPGECSAQSAGASYFALPGYSPKMAARAMRVFDGLPEIRLCTIWRAFGDRNENITAVFRHDGYKPHMLLLHLTNETCRRAPRYCTRFDTIYHNKRAKDFNRFARKRPQRVAAQITKRLSGVMRWIEKDGIDPRLIILGTGLEDNFDGATYKTIRAALAAAWPGRLSRNPVFGGAGVNSADLVELHGEQPLFARRTNLWSNDGNDLCETVRGRADRNCLPRQAVFNTAREHWENGVDVFFWWNNQGSPLPGAKFVEPRRRSIRLYSQDIALINQMLRSL